jgi:hypothetical protein
LIYPFQGDAKRRQKIEKYIANHHSLESEEGVVTLLNEQGNKYVMRNNDTAN